jgi:hypothetical protein
MVVACARVLEETRAKARVVCVVVDGALVEWE